MTLERFSLNVATTKYWPLADAVAGCVAAGVANIGLWREETIAYGLDRAAALVRDAGLRVTSLCRGGVFPPGGWLHDNPPPLGGAGGPGPPGPGPLRGGPPAPPPGSAPA